MRSAVLELLAALLLGALLLALLLPKRGLLWRIVRARRQPTRVLVEDALKHLHDCEYHGHPATLQSLAGALGLPGARAAELVGRLQQLELVAPEDAGYRLTGDGRRYALRVIRIHRLWERFLSDETGLPPTEWHGRAEIEEHRTSPEQAERLAARMGHPRYDPHGDPIPTAAGDIGPRRGRPLGQIEAGQAARIVHVEDEPAEVYARILARRLHPGVRVRILESTPRLVRLEADGEEHALAPVLAANLWVEPLAEPAGEPPRVERLSALPLGSRATVVGISARCRGPERRRMLDLGIVPGTEVAAEMRSPGGDPTAYRIRGSLIALRREQAELIHVDRASGRMAS